MESSRSAGRFLLGKQSSMAPDGENKSVAGTEDGAEVPEAIESTIRLMYLANEGDVKGIEELLNKGVDVNFKDIDDRTALHVAACQGRKDVVELLLRKGAEVDSKDRWGSTPLSDAIYYKNHDVIKLLEEHGAKPLMAPMYVLNDREVPEYEIDPRELDFANSVDITKSSCPLPCDEKIECCLGFCIGAIECSLQGTFRTAFWRGIQVAVKRLSLDVITDEDTVRAFRDELALLQKIRHPNVVQFLGAVTQSAPMMIVTEYLPKGDLRLFLKRKGELRPPLAVKFALDIARGMNYLHENKPEAIIHRDLEPSNILRDDSGHLKVADFGVSQLLRVAKTIKEDRPLACFDNSCRYIAPEVWRNEEYDTKVDVFSFALILQEMIEGSPPFSTKPEKEVPKAYADKVRPPFKASNKHYPYGLRELIEICWDDNPAKRPTFRQIISRLSNIEQHLARRRRWKTRTLPCLPSFEAIFRRGHSDPSSRGSSCSGSL